MRLLLTADAVGGVWTYAIDLARVLCAEGWEVTLAVLGPRPSPAQRKQAEAIARLELVEHDCRLEWMADPWTDVATSGAWLQGVADRVAPSIVHVNGYAHGALDFGAPVVVGAHSCVLSWWHAVKGVACPPAWHAYREQVTRGLRAADAVVAPSHAMARALADCYGIDRRVHVIRNGRDASASSTACKRPFVFSAARLWDEAKNTAALRRVATRVPWPIYLAGEEGMTNPTGHDRCACVGRLEPEQVAHWMDIAAIYAAPARYEPFGLSVLEAALAECALVLGDIASLRELWTGVAWFVPPGDDDALARALTYAIEHPAERRALARRARERALQYSARRMAARYQALYTDLLDDEGRRPRSLACAS